MSELHLREVARFYTRAYPVNAAYLSPDKKPMHGRRRGFGDDKTASTAHFGRVEMRGRFWPVVAAGLGGS